MNWTHYFRKICVDCANENFHTETNIPIIQIDNKVFKQIIELYNFWHINVNAFLNAYNGCELYFWKLFLLSEMGTIDVHQLI